MSSVEIAELDPTALSLLQQVVVDTIRIYTPVAVNIIKQQIQEDVNVLTRLLCCINFYIRLIRTKNKVEKVLSYITTLLRKKLCIFSFESLTPLPPKINKSYFIDHLI